MQTVDEDHIRAEGLSRTVAVGARGGGATRLR